MYGNQAAVVTEDCRRNHSAGTSLTVVLLTDSVLLNMQ